MADNVVVDNGDLPDFQVAADEDAAGKHQYVKLEFGADNVFTKVDATNRLPVFNTPTTPSRFGLDSAATTNATSVKSSAGVLYGFTVSNINAAVRFLKIYNLAVAPTVGTSVPAMIVPIPATTGFVSAEWPLGMAFTTGIAIALTTLGTNADATAVAAGEIKVNLTYI